ncbi:type II secretory pathway, component PulF [Burkholderiales bacterium JOSHI_001]|nr:type II secretory pathway, component PulF [Burkholderiales bacterium JOSHI_001]
MPDYLVHVHEPPRGVVQHRVSAADAGAVAGALGVSPLQLLSVQAVPGGAAVSSGGQGLFVRRGRLSLRLFCQELAVLLDAGIPLLEALSTLKEKESAGSATATALQALSEALRQGRSLSEAMRDNPPAFGPLLVAVVGASERSGQLSIALREHARYLAWAEGLRAKLVGAAIYPALLLGASAAVMLFLLMVVLPRFAGLLDGSGQELPWASRQLMDLGVVLADRPAWLLGALALLALGLGTLWRHALLRAALASLLWRLPGLGPRLTTLALAQCYRTLGMLLAAGVPLVPALGLVQGVVGPRFAAALAGLRADVGAGQRLSDAMDTHHLATPVARRMLRVGERSGELAAMLERAAAFHDEELERLSDFITRAVNPVLMLLMGGLIGGIVVLMYLPIFSLVESVQ